MVATLFYVDALPETGALAVVGGDEGFHAATVRRIRPGEQLVLGDGAGGLAHCVVEQAGRDGLAARVLDRWTVAGGQPAVTVVQALPKSERSELAIELATEAGADAFVAWQADRCVANWQGARADKGLRRWRAVVRSAARQSRRAHIPPVDGVLSTAALTQRIRDDVAAGAVVLALHESAPKAASRRTSSPPSTRPAPSRFGWARRCCGRPARPRWRWAHSACSPPDGISPARSGQRRR